MGLKTKEMNLADYGIEVITDEGSKIVSEPKKTLTASAYNDMLDVNKIDEPVEQKSSVDNIYEQLGETEEKPEIFINAEGAKKVRMPGGNVYPAGSDEYKAAVGEETEVGLKIAMRPIIDFTIMRVEFPMDIVDEINEYIDDVIIPANVSYASGLVGQMKQHERSAQLDMPLDDEVGKQLTTVFNQIGTTYVQSGYKRDATTAVSQCWSNHAYAGDYNPHHDHGVHTVAGLSGFLWLKIPQSIQDTPDVPEINNASGGVDGWTHLVWGLNSKRDIMQLRPQTEDYVKPEVGVMLVFPQWLKHAVLPFYGDGERRSIAMNWNVHDTDSELKKYMSKREAKLYDERKQESTKN